MLERFIELRTMQLEATGLSLVLAQYDGSRFQPALFEQAGIAYPASLQHSVVKRQAEFLAGRLAAARALRHYGLEQQQIAIGRQREPLWPAGYVGSISHTQGFAAAIVRPETEFVGLGLDLEARLSAASQQAMLSVVVNSLEQQRLSQATDLLTQADLLTLVFSAKESFFKAAYPQVQDYFDFDALEFLRLDHPTQTLYFRCATPLSQSLVLGSEIAATYQWLNQDLVLTSVCLACG